VGFFCLDFHEEVLFLLVVENTRDEGMDTGEEITDWYYL